MKLLFIFFSLLILFGCGNSEKKGEVEVSSDITNEVNEEPSNVEKLTQDEESVIQFLNENRGLDYLSAGYEVAKRLRREIRNVDSLYNLLELTKNNKEQIDLSERLITEIKKI